MAVKKKYLVSYIDENGYWVETKLPQKYGVKYPSSLQQAKKYASQYVEGLGLSTAKISVRIAPNIGYEVVQGYFNITFGQLQLTPASKEHYMVRGQFKTYYEALEYCHRWSFIQTIMNDGIVCLVRKLIPSSDFNANYETRFAGLIIRTYEY